MYPFFKGSVSMALCALSDLKSWLGIDTLDTSKDTILTMISNAISKKYDGYCNTKLEETIIVNELYEGSGNTNSLCLNNINVSKINKVEFLINDTWETIYEYKDLPLETIDLYGLNLDKENGIIKLNVFIPSKTGYDILTSNPNYTVKYPNVRVSYVCGFNPVPTDLAYICLKASARQYSREVGGSLQAKSESVFNAKTEFDTSNNSIEQSVAEEEKDVLNGYRKWI